MSDREPVNILLVDDQPAKLLSLRTILEPLGERMIEAAGAEDALRMLLSSEVAVVLVDVCMPRMDGFELARMIREHPRFRRLAIIFISAVHLTDDDRLRGYDLGAVDYISVPIVPDVLRAKVSIVADLYRKTQELERLNTQLASRADEARTMLAAIVESSQDAIMSKTLDGLITSWNSGATMIFGYEASETIGKPITMLIPPELVEQENEILVRLRRGERIAPFETVRVRKDGSRIDVSEAISPLRDSQGRIIGASKVARDISQRKAAELVLARDRDTLEQLVRDRTEQLRATSERLRLADRMATMGTLSVGLGHDISNLLLPIRIRLDAIQQLPLPEPGKQDLEAIRTATHYLQRLASSLRLLAIDPEMEESREGAFDLSEWWQEVGAMMRSCLATPTLLDVHIPAGLAAEGVGRAGLTQVVFNLVQNAGDALLGRTDGRVSIHACNAPQNSIVLSVRDNGSGMTEEIRRRCMEPFFSTKTRGLGTGLGLALVSGILKRAGASLDIESSPGAGTTFSIRLNAAHSLPSPQRDEGSAVAVLELSDKRVLAHLRVLLRSMSYAIHEPGDSVFAGAWITDSPDARRLTQVLDASPTCRVIVVSKEGSSDRPLADHPRVRYFPGAARPSELVAGVRTLLVEREQERKVEYGAI